MSNSYKEFFDKAQQQSGVTKKHHSLSPAAKSSAPTSSAKSLASRSRKKDEPQSFKLSQQKAILSFVVLGFVVTLVGGLYTDEIITFLKSVDISLFSMAGAEENAAGSAASKSEKAAKLSDNSAANEQTTSTGAATGVGKKTDSEGEDVELNHLARLRERKIELDKREEDLAKLEEELTKQRAELEQKLKELENVRRNISSTLEEKVQNDDQKIQDLVLFYSNMKPPQAAKVIETIDETLAVRIIEKMKKKNAADIMNLLKPEKAQALSEKYAGYRK